MKTVIVIQARMGSTRLPGKVLMPLGDNPVLGWVYEAALKAGAYGKIAGVIVATSELEQDDPIAGACHNWGVGCVRGSESDVLSRFVKVMERTGADVLVRLTGDCPFLDPHVIREVIKLREVTGADYASNVDPGTWPDGLDVEVFTARALIAAHLAATRPSDRDCVTRWISRHRHDFPAVNLTCPIPDLYKERWVLDTEEDYKFCQEIAQRIKSYPPSYLDILGILDKEPELRSINGHLTRNERFYEAINTEAVAPREFPVSTSLLEVAERIIPLGAQTFSKSKLQYPKGAPLFVTHGDGAYVYDADGNDFVDLVSGLLPNILGYRDPDVDRAIRDQLDRGINFSMSTTLETELARRLVEYIPCAEMCRFGKTGTDVTTAAIRLARAYTGRDRILKAVNGYHGWADWSVERDEVRNNGVPLTEHTSSYPFGDSENAEMLLETGQFAAVIVEPETNPQHLEDLKRLCTKTGTVLIFDEIITGFRFGLGGAQKHWGVTPDLACFGKAMANGMPISALVGKREIMQTMEKVCFSGTFFGEALSLAAAIATIDKLDACNVPNYLRYVGTMLKARVLLLIAKHGLSDHIRISAGHPAMTRIEIKDPRIKTLFMECMIEKGVLVIASHNVNYAMKEPEIVRICNAWDYALETIKCLIDNSGLDLIEEIVSPTVREAS